MNELQMAILGAGAALVAAIWGHGKWQEWRQRRIARGLLNPTQADALLGESLPISPVSPTATAAEERGETPIAVRREPVIGELPSREALPALATLSMVLSLDDAGEPATFLLSPEVDFIAAFELGEPLPGEALSAVSREALADMKKRIAWVGFDESGHGWEMLRAGGSYRKLRVGIQLADRAGPLSAGMLEQFRLAMDVIADELAAVVNMPLPREALFRAVKLDRICAEVDIQVSVSIVARHPPFALDAIRKAALDTGFRLGSDGLLAFVDAAGDRLFVLHAPREVEGKSGIVTFVHDLPCVVNGEAAFDRMIAVVREFAEMVDGIVVDEHKRPVSDRFIAPVRAQIGELRTRMQAQGIAPGSEIALRLFA